MAKALLDLGYGHLLKNWPRLGIHDAEKRAYLHATSRSVKQAVTSNEASRLSVLKVAFPNSCYLLTWSIHSTGIIDLIITCQVLTL